MQKVETFAGTSFLRLIARKIPVGHRRPEVPGGLEKNIHILELAHGSSPVVEAAYRVLLGHIVRLPGGAEVRCVFHNFKIDAGVNDAEILLAETLGFTRKFDIVLPEMLTPE